MRQPPKPGFLLVARREWRWLLHDRAALILIFGVPLFAFVVLTAVFSHPVIRGLGVVVVDADRSDASRAFVDTVAASPGLSIVRQSGDLSTAARAIRSGDAISAVYIPANFERDLKAARRPQVVAFYNQQFLTAAGIAASSLSDSLSDAVERAALGREFDRVTVQRKLKDAGRFVFIDRVKKNPSFLKFVEPTIAKARASLARLADDEDMRALSDLLARVLPE